MSTQEWWKNSVGYQIYPRSFQDSNGDGIGDIRGIISRLDYLVELGVDFIWINPVYKSPNVDNGYDISDYEAIQPEYGTLDDVKELIAACHQKNIKVLFDLVVNHTSNLHPWFVEAMKSKDNPYHDYYLFVDNDGTTPPNNWESFFGNSAWEYVPQLQQSYLHIFAKEQPDLNWKNKAMRAEIYQMMRFWLDLGLDGFRLDAISHIQKADWAVPMVKTDKWRNFMNVAGIEQYMTELKQVFDEYHVLTVGEASGVSSKKAPEWTGDGGYINMIFELEHNQKTGKNGSEVIDLPAYQDVIYRWQRDQLKEGWNALYIENHDNPRAATIFGNDNPEYLKTLALSYFLLRGTPFIYQGQEIGMTNFPYSKVEQFDGVDAKMQYADWLAKGDDELTALKKVGRVSRDNSRTPMQWSGETNAGFTNATPWMNVNPDYTTRNVASEEQDAASLLSFYKQLISLKKSSAAFGTGTIKLITSEPGQFVFERVNEDASYLVVANLTTLDVELPAAIVNNYQTGKIVLSTGAAADITKVKPGTGLVIQKG